MLLEDSRHSNQQIAGLLSDLVEVFPPAVRVMFVASEKDDWSFRSPAGLKILACFLAGLPDTKIIEDTHQHLRDPRRRPRCMVSSKVSRSRACMDAGILEGRGLQHDKVTKTEFISKFRKRVARMSSNFAARHHKLSEPWSEIMDKRTWSSKSPEHSRSSFAAWSWVVEWGLRTSAPRPPVSSPRISGIAGDNCVLLDPDGALYFCLGSCDWGAAARRLKNIGNYNEVGGDELAAWALVGEFVWLHLRIMTGWRVVPHVACSPARCRGLLPNVPAGIYALQTGKPVPLLEHVLSSPIKVSFKDLQEVGIQAGADVRGLSSREALTRAIASTLMQGRPDDVSAAFIDKAVKMCDSQPETTKIDPWTELAFDGLDPAEQLEFKDVKDAIQKNRKSAKLAKYKDDARKRKAADAFKRGRAKVKAKGRGRGGGSGTAAASSAQPAAAAAAPTPPAEPHARESSARDPDVFSWGTGAVQFEFTRRRGDVAGWKARCQVHQPENGPRGGVLPCTPELSKGAVKSARPDIADDDLDEAVVRQLKRWCVAGVSGDCARLTRRDHMNHQLFPRVLPEGQVGTDSQLSRDLRLAVSALS